MRCVLYIYILFGRESSVHTVVPVGNTIVNDEACWRPDSVAVSWYVPLLESHACCTGHNKAWPLAHSIDLSSWKSSLLVRGYTFVSCSVQCSLSSKLSFAMQSKVISFTNSHKVFMRVRVCACEFWKIKCHTVKVQNRVPALATSFSHRPCRSKATSEIEGSDGESMAMLFCLPSNACYVMKLKSTYTQLGFFNCPSWGEASWAKVLF